MTVAYGGPVLAIAFLFPFVFRILPNFFIIIKKNSSFFFCLSVLIISLHNISWLDKEFSTSDIFIGIYFTVFLCLYDTIFNWVLLSRSIWLQENVVNLKDKLVSDFITFVFISFIMILILIFFRKYTFLDSFLHL